MEKQHLEEPNARFICIQFLLLHEAMKQKKGYLDKVAKIVFSSNNKNGRNPRLSQAKDSAENWLGETACNLSKLPRFGQITLEDINTRILDTGSFSNSMPDISLEELFIEMKTFFNKSKWVSWKDNTLLEFKKAFKVSNPRLKEWSGLTFGSLSDEAIRKAKDEDFDIYYVSAIYNNREFESKYKAIFKIVTQKNIVVSEDFELSIDNNHRLVSRSVGKMINEGDVVHFLFEDKQRTRFISISKGDADWQSASPFLHGTFAWADNNGPTVGKIFLLQAPNELNAKQMIGTLADPVVQTALLYKRISAGNNVAYDMKDLPAFNELQYVKDIAGEYKGYYLSHHQSQLLFECHLEINESGKVRFRENRADAEPSRGVARFFNNVFMIRLNYEPAIDFYHSFINLKRSYIDANSVVLQGTFGFPLDIDLPQSGRIFFYKTTNSIENDNQSNIPINNKITEQSILLEVVQLKLKSEIDKFLGKGPIALEIIKFLQGFANDRMSDDPFLCFLGTEWDLRKTQMNAMGIATYSSQLGLSATEPPESWVGQYEFYIFQHHLHPVGFRLELMKMEITKNGIIKFFAKRTDYVGVVFKTKNKADALLAAISKEDSTQQDVFMCLQEINQIKDQNKTVFGTYAGFGQVSELQPTGGRFIAYKIDKDQEIRSEEYDLKDEATRVMIAQRRPDLFDYFLGINDTIVGSYKMFNELRMIPHPNSQVKNEIQNLKGCYRLLKLTSKMNEIADSLLVIMGDGRVQLTSIDGKTYHGVVNICLGMMAFTFQHINDEDTFALSLFAKAEKSLEVENYLVGLHLSKILDQPQAYCARTILKKVSSSPEEASKMEPIKMYEIPKDRHSEAFSTFTQKNIEYNNGLCYLTGPDNNFLRGPHGQWPENFNKTNWFQKRFDHGLSLFLASKLFSSEEDGHFSIEKTKQYWEAALENGFSDENLINLFITDMANRKAYYKESRDQILQMLREARPFALPKKETNKNLDKPDLDTKWGYSPSSME
jgi:hypothetical protein